MVIASCKWFMVFCLPLFFLSTRSDIAGIPGQQENTFHPFHVSVTEINHNAVEKTLEISCKIFTDDFEETLSKKFKTKVDLVKPGDKVAMDKLLNEYIHEHLQLKADNKAVVLNYLGYEVESEAVFVYLQAINIGSVKKIDAVNTILHDMFNDQTEIMHVSVAGNRKSMKMDYPDSRATFQF
ncbi:MAG: hypothetical protein JWM28_2927 [Chitinophagaceae bacterium]|nr:hypothetical protein [Chitinophagaceae bacterium]